MSEKIRIGSEEFVARPIGRRVLLRLDKALETFMEGGRLAIPAGWRRAPVSGTVLALGPKCREALKPGDHVVFSKYSVRGMDKDHERDLPEWGTVHEADILAVIDE